MQTSLLCWLDAHAGAIQALCAVIGAVGLIVYCLLTQGIRKSTLEQQRSSQAPMLMFYEGDDGWLLKNYGSGPATRVWWKPGCTNEKSDDWYNLGALATGDISNLPHHSRPQDSSLKEMPIVGARLHYSDMAGNHYESYGAYKDGAFYQDWHRIKNKDRPEPKQRPFQC